MLITKRKENKKLFNFFGRIFYIDKPCFTQPGKIYEDSGSAL